MEIVKTRTTTDTLVSRPGRAEEEKPVLLIVDDEEGPRESLRLVFKDRFRCLVADGGRKGIEYAKENPVDVAVLDIKMPDISGTEVLRQLKAVDSATECILLTGYETIETAREAVRYGAADYLNKPFDVFAIRELADRCLDRRRKKLSARDSLEKLEKINQELTVEVARSDRAIAAGVLASGVVHQLSHPLSIIAGYSEILRCDLMALENSATAGPASRQIQDRLALIVNEVDRCKHIAARLLSFARKSEGAPEVIQVAELIEDAVSLVKAHPEGRDADLSWRLAQEDLYVIGWPSEILQVLINVGINGLQATTGKRVLAVEAAPAGEPPADCVYRSESFDARQALVRIGITDQGCGIPREAVSKVLQPYYTTKLSGTGLGLAVAAEIVNRHRGLIDIKSTEGKGTSVIIYLPRAESPLVEDLSMGE